MAVTSIFPLLGVVAIPVLPVLIGLVVIIVAWVLIRRYVKSQIRKNNEKNRVKVYGPGPNNYGMDKKLK